MKPQTVAADDTAFCALVEMMPLWHPGWPSYEARSACARADLCTHRVRPFRAARDYPLRVSRERREGYDDEPRRT